MRFHPNEISKIEKGILQRQFEASPFYKGQTIKTEPKTLKIFDFDSTLFLSPLLSSNLWHRSLITAIIKENLLGPGWWRDYRSLELGPFEELEEKAWDGYWNEGVVEQAREAIADENSLTVMLTGRRHHPFHSIVHSILKSKGLFFDAIGLRPDPEDKEPDNSGLMYNVMPNVFETTMSFKSSFIINMLENVPSLQNIIMWDDRPAHVDAFSIYINDLISENVINSGAMIAVKAVRPRYNPDWEYAVVNKIIDSHNSSIDRYFQHKAENPDEDYTEREEIWEQAKVVNNGSLATWKDQYKLTQIKSSVVVNLKDDAVDILRNCFELFYEDEITQGRTVAYWEKDGGEGNIYFGTHVFLGQALIDQDILFGGLGSSVDVKVIGRSYACPDHGMLLKVVLKQHQEEEYAPKEYLLPLWHKPSKHLALNEANYRWCELEVEHQLVLHGEVQYGYLLGVETIPRSSE
ncbi:hypothetical protein CLU79DRAFT_719680 [Phycomyces nitens]|nr:hypothetical protein CLU79DRAFT_719680 [Phycomyces nitens]